jgi:hypothetical protein
MFDYHDTSDNTIIRESFALKEHEVPEPLESWSLEEFDDLMPGQMQG